MRARYFLLMFVCALARATCAAEAVSPSDILPMRVMYEAVSGDHRYHDVLDISSTATVLRRFEHGSLTPVGSMRTDIRALEDALAGADKDFFRGTVAYSHPHMRDGTRVRLTTPLGDITEYSVFTIADRIQWPQAILRLKPLFGTGPV